VAKPGHPVLVIMGDAGIGVGGMEIETCARYKMPVVSIIWNNSEWMGGAYYLLYETVAGDNRMQQDIKYHEMFGCLEDVHSELCTRPEQLVPALERSFNSGKTAVVNALTAPLQIHPWLEGVPVNYIRAYGLERAREVLPGPGNFEKWFEERHGIPAEEALPYITATSRYLGI